jgi:hypothetical protein
VKVKLGRNICTVERGDSPKIYSESWLWAKIRDELKRQGFDVIKKNPDKDGQMWSDSYYIRSRNQNKPGFALYHNEYALRFLYEDFNKEGTLTLAIMRWE